MQVEWTEGRIDGIGEGAVGRLVRRFIDDIAAAR